MADNMTPDREHVRRITDHVPYIDPETGDCRTCNAIADAKARFACNYLGRILHDPDYTADTTCPNEARGRLIGTGGEVGPLACFACAAVALNYEDGARGYLPLELLVPGGIDGTYYMLPPTTPLAHFAPVATDTRLCGQCSTRRATRHEDGGPYLCDQCES